MSFLWEYDCRRGPEAPAGIVEAAYTQLPEPVCTVSRTQVPLAVSAVLM